MPFTNSHAGDFASLNKWNRRFWLDLAERTGSTFLQSLAGTSLLMGATALDWTDATAVWATLGAPTALALGKGLLANMANGESGASVLPSPPGPDVNDPGH